MSVTLTAKITAVLTVLLGRAPTDDEIAMGLTDNYVLGQVLTSFNIGQSIVSLTTTDDIQSAIDNLSTDGGGTVYLAGGTYNLTDDLTVPSDIKLVGVGSGGSILDFGNLAKGIKIIGTSMDHIISPSLIGLSIQNSTIELITLDYVDNFFGNDITCTNGLTGLTGTNLSLFNFEIFDAEGCGTGMSLTTVDGMTIDNMAVAGATSGGGFVFDTVNNATFTNSSVESSTGDGISMTNCTDFTFDSYSIISMTGIGLLLDGCSVLAASNGTIESNGGDGLKLQNTTSNCQFTTTNFNSNGGYGTNVSDSGSTENIFAINDFSGNSSGALQDNGTSTLIRSNIGVADN